MIKARFLSFLSAVVFLVFQVSSTAQISSPAPSKAKLHKQLRKSFSFVPASMVQFKEEIKSVNGFYISKFEVTNADYRAFLSDLKKSGKLELHEKCKVDSNNWSNEHPNAFFEPMVNQYHSHPAYDNYPVVNITKEAAQEYCSWLTKQLNDEYKEDGFTFLIRLPQQYEWLSAANGNFKNITYSWGGNRLRNAKGCYLANFNTYGPESITYNQKKDRFEVVENLKVKEEGLFFLTAPVDSYSPSQLDIYNLNGNAAEMVTENLAFGGSWFSPGYDIRNESNYEFSGVSSKVGFRPVMMAVQH